MMKWMKFAVEIKTRACLIFTGSVLIYTILYGILVDWMIPGTVVLELALISLVCSAVQFLFFSGIVIRHMSYLKRTMCALPVFLIAMVAAAVLFQWFPVEEWRDWLIFLGIFVLMFAGCAVGFEIYFRIAGRKYDDLLEDYRRKYEKNQ